MKAVYFDLFSGVSGDMFLGALLDVGVDFAVLRQGLQQLPVNGYRLHVARRAQGGITGTKLDVQLEESRPHPQAVNLAHDHVHALDPLAAEPPSAVVPPHFHPPHATESTPFPSPAPRLHSGPGHRHVETRDFRDISALISGSPLSSWVRERAIGVFRRLAEAEGRIHGLPPEQVHFHEVGAVDSIVDVVGGCLALEALGCPRVFAAPVVEGTGWVHCAHGRFPVPAPATLEILAARGLTVSQCEEPHEMVTPTGAALLAELAEGFGPMPALRLERVGYGLGTRQMLTRPNVLRAVLGELASAPASAAATHDWETDQVACLETNLDDLNPELLGHFMERVLAAGALDVCYHPVQMKKCRPGVVLTLLCPVSEADRFAEMVLVETSAFGLRRTVAERRKLRRELQTVDTPFGKVTLKLGQLNGRTVQVAPEYESCRSVAATAGVPVKAVYAAALRACPVPSPGPG